MTAWSEGNVQANGITIHYHRTGGNNKPSIVLLHGVTDNGLCWSRVAHDLEGSYDVIMTDARGHGRSGISATEFSLALLADDAVAVIRALNLEKPFLFGHSMGPSLPQRLPQRIPIWSEPSCWKIRPCGISHSFRQMWTSLCSRQVGSNKTSSGGNGSSSSERSRVRSASPGASL